VDLVEEGGTGLGHGARVEDEAAVAAEAHRAYNLRVVESGGEALHLVGGEVGDEEVDAARVRYRAHRVDEPCLVGRPVGGAEDDLRVGRGDARCAAIAAGHDDL